MTTRMRSLRNFRNPIGCLILLAALGAASGCSNAETPSGSATNMNHVLPSGSSVPGWMVVPSGGSHTSTATQDYIANGGASGCTECHGSDLSGGISGTSCFGNTAGCHHGPVAATWVTAPPAAQQHGVSAKKAPGSSGFASCQICHGADFRTVRGGSTCFTCHTTAPHAPGPWRGPTYTHGTTDNTNAPVCYQCHSYTGTVNPNNPHVPPTPAPTGTAPGCFNGTMCHNEATPHPLGSPAWYATPPAAQPHGSVDNGAKGAPGTTTGFLYCQSCHGTGTDFAGGSSGVSCTNNPNAACHGPAVASPHPPTPWRGSPYTHATTNPGNASVCANCHRNANPGTPDCFNNTLCHAQPGTVAHPIPYNDASHYAVTSTTFTGSCDGCHDVTTPTTKVGPVCQSCHVAASPLTAANCTSCHASPPNGGTGATYANIAGAHAVHIALTSAGTPISCDTCHNGLGTNTLNHYNSANSRVAPGDAAFLATYNAQTGASSFNSAALTCGNISCHGGTTPNWQTGALNVNTQCTSCHSQGTAQFNSYNSGDHGINSDHSNCTNCHNTTTLAVNHFTNLSTTAMEGPASATIGGTGTSIPAGNYVVATRSCTPSCHGNETW
jgi:predicted CxxxxCH...CXXCH cytochrome family protein